MAWRSATPIQAAAWVSTWAIHPAERRAGSNDSVSGYPIALELAEDEWAKT